MQNIPQSTKADFNRELIAMQTRLPVSLVRRAKAVAAENGSTLQELVKAALEQYLGFGQAA